MVAPFQVVVMRLVVITVRLDESVERHEFRLHRVVSEERFPFGLNRDVVCSESFECESAVCHVFEDDLDVLSGKCRQSYDFSTHCPFVDSAPPPVSSSP